MLEDGRIDDLIDKLVGGDPDKLCNCGTKADALDVAIKLVNQMIANDCVTWAMQVCSAMHLIRVGMMQAVYRRGGISSEVLRELARLDTDLKHTMMTKRSHEFADIVEKTDKELVAVSNFPDKGLEEFLKQLRTVKKE